MRVPLPCLGQGTCPFPGCYTSPVTKDLFPVYTQHRRRPRRSLELAIWENSKFPTYVVNWLTGFISILNEPDSINACAQICPQSEECSHYSSSGFCSKAPAHGRDWVCHASYDKTYWRWYTFFYGYGLTGLALIINCSAFPACLGILTFFFQVHCSSCHPIVPMSPLEFSQPCAYLGR